MGINQAYKPFSAPLIRIAPPQLKIPDSHLRFEGDFEVAGADCKPGRGSGAMGQDGSCSCDFFYEGDGVMGRWDDELVTNRISEFP
ncbi:hypothetical protein ACLOJK_026064 [Asimina triloba]